MTANTFTVTVHSILGHKVLDTFCVCTPCGGRALSSKTLSPTPNKECNVRIAHMKTDMKIVQAGNQVFFGVRYSWSADVRRRSLAVTPHVRTPSIADAKSIIVVNLSP